MTNKFYSGIICAKGVFFLNIKLYSAVTDVELNEYLKDTFSNDFIFTVVGNSNVGQVILEDINLFNPDIIILNDKLIDMDMLDFASKVVASSEKIPCFIVITDDVIVPKLEKILGRFIVYGISGRAKFSDVINKIVYVSSLKFYDFSLDSVSFPYVHEKIICSFLDGFGMYCNDKGYRYLVKIIKLMYSNPCLTYMTVRELCSIIAKRENETSVRICRRINKAVVRGWHNRENMDPNGLYSKAFSHINVLPSLYDLIALISKVSTIEYENYLRQTKLFLRSYSLLMEDEDYILDDNK